MPLVLHAFGVTEDFRAMNRKQIDSEGGRIVVRGDIHPQHLRRCCASLYRTIESQGYKDIILDFSDCTHMEEATMLPILPVVEQYKKEFEVDCEIILPNYEQLSRLFINANWAHHIQQEKYELQDYQGGNVPALKFGIGADSEHGDDTLDRVMELILRNLDTDPGSLKAVEWSLGEIMDNVTNHAQSSTGAFVQATAYKQSNSVEFIVADGGIGIPATMKLRDHAQALREAIDEGRTSDETRNAGNGLYGSFQAAILSGGQFEMNSHKGFLYCNRQGNIVNRNENIPYNGTSVRCRIGLDDPELLGKALRFKGKASDPPFQFIERAFENEEGELIIDMKKQARRDFGSRQGGIRIRKMLENLLRNGGVITLDFKDVAVITSSFADEVFGRLFYDMGPRMFMERIRMRNVDPTVNGLIDRAIVQRTRLGNGGG